MNQNKSMINKLIHLEPDDVIHLVCDYLKVSKSVALSKSQKTIPIKARSISMYFMYHHMNMSQTEVGSYFVGRKGGKDHASIIHALKTLNNLTDTDSRYRRQFDDIKELIFKKERNLSKKSALVFIVNKVCKIYFFHSKKTFAIAKPKDVIIKEPDIYSEPYNPIVRPHRELESANNQGYHGFTEHRL